MQKRQLTNYTKENFEELIETILSLLNCTDLSLDELDETSIEAIDNAIKVLKKYCKNFPE